MLWITTSSFNDTLYFPFSKSRRDRLTETRPCYISVMSSWPKVRCVDVFHFKLELLLHQPMVCVVNSTSPFKQDGENEDAIVG